MTQKNINQNTVFSTVKSVASILYPVLAFPYISRTLMTDNLGKVNFGNSIISYFSLLATLGVTTYAIRECSKVRDDQKELSKLASQIFSINIYSTLISFLGLFLLLAFARHLESYRTLICIQSASILFTALGAEWLNNAMEDFKYMAIRTVSIQLISLILLYTFVRKPEDYLKYAAIAVFAASGSNIINIFYRRKYCKIRFIWKIDVKKHLPPILLMFSLIVSQTIYTNSDMTILGWIKGDHQVGLYSTAVSIYNIINSTVASIAWVVLPQLSVAFAGKNYDDVNKMLKHAMNYIIVLGLPCICGMEIIAPHLVVFIAGEAYEGAALALRILGASLLFSFFGGWIGNGILIPSGKEKICLFSSITCATINIVLNLILIPIWGLYAAALTTCIAELTGLIIAIRFFDRNVKISGLRQQVTGPLIGCVGILITGFVTQRIFHQAWLVSVCTIVFGIVLYCGIMIATRNEFFMGFLRPLYNRITRRNRA